MDYIHVKNLEKYHPGYKDRQLHWAKLHFGMVQGNPQFEMIENEVDKWRAVTLICLELQAKQPLPYTPAYFARKGWDLKRRKCDKTIQTLMIHNFLVIDTEDSKLCAIEESRVEKNRVEESRENLCTFTPPTVIEMQEYVKEANLSLNPQAFIDFYESKGWLVGKSKMKDWKAAARNWSRREVDKNPTTSTRKLPTAQDLVRKYKEEM